ncbi:MAG: hypothetical protein C0615_00485 [Desulfuromonas sp.]|nr:MAG: hypothetical protein C0615_00485 [Desulfuromonas sp.]
MKRTILVTTLIALFIPASVAAEKNGYALNIYGAELTANHWEEFFDPSDSLDFQGSYLAAIALAQTVGHYRESVDFEVEGQVVKHFEIQDHWEFNLLGLARWEPFPWDKYIETSIAFGIGPSWASEKPPIEVKSEGDSEQLLVYWLLELAFSSPTKSEWAFITRIHHRSEAYGLVAERGGSNALAFGLKYRF